MVAASAFQRALEEVKPEDDEFVPNEVLQMDSWKRASCGPRLVWDGVLLSCGVTCAFCIVPCVHANKNILL